MYNNLYIDVKVDLIINLTFISKQKQKLTSKSIVEVKSYNFQL